MRLFADTNIVAHAVRAMRAAGHDVVYAGERSSDPGDAALLAEAASQDRIFVTKDCDIGVLVYRDRALHAGVLLIDDLGDPMAETALLVSALADGRDTLASRGFVRTDGANERPWRS